MGRQSMIIKVKDQPSEEQLVFWWKDKKIIGVADFECVEHNLVKRSAIQNYMTFNGVDEYEEHWLQCTTCGQQFDMNEELYERI